ncbi:MAG: CPBP family intramembrane metalloprotease [Planctomycetes bacterium]|nr:CPBP family intramembrane metalloprotease [Planctomycetota bacterium]MBI3843982.1 CPBP family intramembrane metalloprotease [Planctomycetota bacterium]
MVDAVSNAPERRLEKRRRLALYVIVFFGVWTIRATVLLRFDRDLQPPIVGQIYRDALRVLVWVVPAVLYVRRLDGRSALESLKLVTRPTASAIRRAVALIVVYVAAEIALDSMVLGKHLGVGQWSRSQWIEFLVALPVAPVAEEILFRGFILTKLREIFPFWKANLATSLLFVAIHWPGWLTMNGWQPPLLMTLSATIFVLALFLGYLVKLTDSLWPSVVMHLLNNVVSVVMRVA